MHLETSAFLKPLSPDKDRSKRAVPAAAAALGAIGLFRAGLAMGPGSCGLSGIFGSCQSEKNAQEINQLFEFASPMLDNVQALNEETNDRFFIVSNELRTLRDIQNDMRKIQNSNWKITVS